jgi:hypothetical protein
MERLYFGLVCLRSRCILYLDKHLFLKIWGVFCYYFVEYASYAFSLHPFFFNAHDKYFGLLVKS